MNNLKNFLILLLVSLLLIRCGSENNISDEAVCETKSFEIPKFNADSAYYFIEKQVAFGPRVPNTPAHEACANYLISKFKEFNADVIVQSAKLKAWDNTILTIKNIIAQYNVEKNNRILLCAHWDTRPWADHDSDEIKRNSPFDGANDGASGVGVLLEIARQMSIKLPNIGVDIILFDAEDYGQPENRNITYKEDTWCLGSQYWAKNPHKKPYNAQYGILLDMVGAKNALFTREGTSMYFAERIVNDVWNIATKLGYSQYFSFDKTAQITDDHLYINMLANIPTIDIIHYDPDTKSKFFPYWHTHNDTMEHIDKNVLMAVGHTLLYVLYSK